MSPGGRARILSLEVPPIMSSANNPGELASLSDALASLVSTFGAHLLTVHGRGHRASTGIAWSKDGLVLTADHTVERDDDLVFTLPSGAQAPARLVGRDPSTDLALLKVEAELSPPELASADTARVGHLVLALGRGRGAVQASLGLLRSVGGPWRTGGGGQVDALFDVDGSLPRGFSGGPLVDARGRVLGLNTGALVRGGTTLPVATLQRVVASLSAHGRVQRAYFGLGAVPAALSRGLAKVAGQPEALLVASIEADGPADQAGVIVGDVLLSIEGAPVARLPELLAQLGEDRVGRSVSLRLLRGGEPREIPVTLGARAANRC